MFRFVKIVKILHIQLDNVLFVYFNIIFHTFCNTESILIIIVVNQQESIVISFK